MIRLREMSSEEQQMIERLAHSRTAEARLVERARMVRHACQGLSVPAIAAELGLHHQTVRNWLKRFNTPSLEGLHDLPRAEVRELGAACQAVEAATAYWNKHRHPFKWGPRRRRFEPSGTTGSRCGSLASQWRQKLHELAG